MLHWSKHSENTFITTTKLFALFVRCINIFSIQRERNLKKNGQQRSRGGVDIKICNRFMYEVLFVTPQPPPLEPVHEAWHFRKGWTRNTWQIYWWSNKRITNTWIKNLHCIIQHGPAEGLSWQRYDRNKMQIKKKDYPWIWSSRFVFWFLLHRVTSVYT